MTDIDTESYDDPGTGLREALSEIRRVIVGQDAMLERLLVSLLAGGHVLLEGVPGPGQDADAEDARAGARGFIQPRPVHPRPGARRPRRHARLPPRQRPLRHRARAGHDELPARRRDQPRTREGAVGAARGHAGAAGHDRRHDPPGAAAVPRDGDAEPDRVRGHLRFARGPARPLPDEDRRRLPVPRRRRPRSSGAACSPRRTCASA